MLFYKLLLRSYDNNLLPTTALVLPNRELAFGDVF